jgi:UDP-N-acetylmuramate dehydrogenase
VVNPLDAVAAALGERAASNRPLGARTTYRVGGDAALLAEVHDEEGLAAVHAALAAAGEAVALLVLGQGSNLLVADAGFPGLVVVLGPEFDFIDVRATTVRAGGATSLPRVARHSAGAGLRGLEWGVGVPGSVGGALRMNAGGHGSDIAAVLTGCRLFDLASGQGTDFGPDRMALGYRRSAVGPSDVVVWGEFSLAPGDRDVAAAAVAEVVRWRRDHQPGGSNAGSVFTNPDGDSAGRLVEEAGLKGLRMGSAQVSPKHANFIQADKGGSADDVHRLIEHVRSVVADRTGVVLEPEVRLIGFPGRALPRVLAQVGPDESPAGRSDGKVSSSSRGRAR